MQVGRDPRLSGPVLAPAIAAGMATQGASVARFGPATTPAMFMSCVLEGAPVLNLLKADVDGGQRHVRQGLAQCTLSQHIAVYLYILSYTPFVPEELQLLMPGAWEFIFLESR